MGNNAYFEVLLLSSTAIFLLSPLGLRSEESLGRGGIQYGANSNLIMAASHHHSPLTPPAHPLIAQPVRTSCAAYCLLVLLVLLVLAARPLLLLLLLLLYAPRPPQEYHDCSYCSAPRAY